MKRFILFLILLIPFLAFGQNTVTLPSGTSQATPIWRTYGTITDSIAKRYFLQFPNGAWNEIYTGTYVNLYFARKSSLPVSGNATATIGFTPVNGSSPNFMRADGAPKLDSAVVATASNHPTLSQLQSKVNLYVPLNGAVTINDEKQSTFTPISSNDLARFGDLELVNTVFTPGMAVSTVTTTATIASGTYRLDNLTYTWAGGTVTIPAQDASKYRYSILYITIPGTIGIINGSLVTADPVIPTFPANSVEVAIIYIPPIGQTVTVTGGGKKNTGTVTRISPGWGMNFPPITTTGLVTADSLKVQSVLGFFPKGDTRWQKILISGTNIKTINGGSLLGSGNVSIPSVNLYNSDGTVDTNRTVGLGTHTFTIGGTVISGSSSLNTTLIMGNDGTINIGAGDLTRGHTSSSQYSSAGLLQTYSDNYAGSTYDTLKMNDIGVSLHHSDFGSVVGFDFGSAYSGMLVTDQLSHIGWQNAGNYEDNIKLHRNALVTTFMLNAARDSISGAFIPQFFSSSINANLAAQNFQIIDTASSNQLLSQYGSGLINNEIVNTVDGTDAHTTLSKTTLSFGIYKDFGSSGKQILIDTAHHGMQVLDYSGYGVTLHDTLDYANGLTDTLSLPPLYIVKRLIATGGGGGGFVPTSRSLTINGVAHNLTADQSWSVGTLTASNFVTAEIPSGSINSSNTAFTLANTPTSGTVKIYRNGMRQIVGTDYTISGTAITYLYAPTTGNSIIVDYQK